jgi:hypothetical protein
MSTLNQVSQYLGARKEYEKGALVITISFAKSKKLARVYQKERKTWE